MENERFAMRQQRGAHYMQKNTSGPFTQRNAVHTLVKHKTSYENDNR